MITEWVGHSQGAALKNEGKNIDPHFEKKLMDSFSQKEFIQAGKGRYYPKMIRGLPREYHRNRPSQSQIKSAYVDLPALKRAAFSKALFSQYSSFDPGAAQVSIAKPRHRDEGWIAMETAAILKGQFPSLKVSLQEEGMVLPRGYGHFGTVPLSVDSLGLHFLEKGVIVWKPELDAAAHQRFHQWFHPDHRFYFADLITEVGTAIYLHALLKSLESDGKNIDLCVPDGRALIQYLETQEREGAPILKGEVGVASIEIGFGTKTYLLAEKGKKVRILCPDYLSREDRAALVHLSGDFVAISGDQGFTDAITADKVYFYDGDDSNQGFLRDLHALAENRLAGQLSVLTLFRSMNQALLHNLPFQEGEWVDEAHFQEADDWMSIASDISMSLKHPATVTAYKNFNRIVREEFSANPYLCHLFQRALCHQKHPQLQELEEELIDDLIFGARSFSEVCRLLVIPSS